MMKSIFYQKQYLSFHAVLKAYNQFKSKKHVPQEVKTNYFSSFLKNFIREKNDEEKLKLLPYLAKNVYHPDGYTFLSYVVNKNLT